MHCHLEGTLSDNFQGEIMKLHRISLIALLLSAPLAFAQVSKPTPTMPAEMQAPMQDQPQPQTDAPPPQPAVIVLPERVVETTVDLKTGGPKTGQSDFDARKEAVNSLAETKAACRHEKDRAAQDECLHQAMAEYNAVMARTSHRQK